MSTKEICQKLLQFFKVIKSDIKTLKELYSARKSDLSGKQAQWSIQVVQTKQHIDELLNWVSEQNEPWPLSQEIMCALDSLDYLEQYVEDLQKTIQTLYEQQYKLSQASQYFAEQLKA